MISTGGGKGGLEPGSGGSLDSRVRWGRQWRAFHTGCWRGGLSESWGDEAGVSVAKTLDVMGDPMDEDAAGQKTRTRTTNGWDLDWRLAGRSGLKVQGPRGSYVLTEAVSSVEKETVCGRRRDGLTQRRSAKTECTRRAGVHGKVSTYFKSVVISRTEANTSARPATHVRLGVPCTPSGTSYTERLGKVSQRCVPSSVFSHSRRRVTTDS